MAEGDARVDELAREEVGAGLFCGGLEGQVREGGGRGVWRDGAEVGVGGGAEDLGEDYVALGGVVLCFMVLVVVWEGDGCGMDVEAYAVRVVLYPHGVFERVGYELAGDGWHDVGGGDVSEARA